VLEDTGSISVQGSGFRGQKGRDLGIMEQKDRQQKKEKKGKREIGK
jgi:hypothetical protein